MAQSSRKQSNITVLNPVTPEPSADQDEVWNHEDVRKFLKLDDVSQVKELTRKRAKRPLPRHSVGKHVRFTKSEVVAWFNAGLEE